MFLVLRAVVWCFPAMLAYWIMADSARVFVDADWPRWLKDNRWKRLPRSIQFVLIFYRHQPFRNVFRHRLRTKGSQLDGVFERFLRYVYYGERTLNIQTKDIGPGLRIQHGTSTYIGAKSIGANCWINQEVTIGYTNTTDAPTIGDNVVLAAGAKVLGNVRVGDNSVIGANAVVIEDVPAGSTVAVRAPIVLKMR